MKELFVITIRTKKDYSNISGFFTDGGAPVGRILDIKKNTIDPKNAFFLYDVETTEDMFLALKSGEAKLYRIEDYTIDKCSTFYYNN